MAGARACVAQTWYAAFMPAAWPWACVPRAPHSPRLDTNCETYPADDEVDPEAYIKAMDQFKRGDAVIIFTPDDTHFTIALAAIRRGLHVLVTKPPVKTLEEHRKLAEAAREEGVALDLLALVAVDVSW